MSTNPKDPSGYYSILGVAPGATLKEIKAAYRAKAKTFHPDHNGEPGAVDEFHAVAEAYAVLKDVVRRAEYDSTGSPGGVDDGVAPSSPFTCSRCGQVTAQPRYVVMHQVKSFLVWASMGRVEGIFCRDCADHAATQASTRTWAWGWWSPPGLLLTPIALIRNLLGGTKPRQVNARILIRQARAFLAGGETDLAYAVACQARPYARVATHLRQVEDILAATGNTGRRLKDRWKPWSGRAFIPQLLPLAALPLIFAMFAVILLKPWDTPVSGAAAGISVSAPQAGEVRHVAVDALKIRQAPLEGAPLLTLLDRFTTVTTVSASEDPEWANVRTPSGVTGWVPTRSLYGGSGERLRSEWCDEHRGARPQAGEVMMRRASGDHELFIDNPGRKDALVKLKTPAGYTMISYFVPATYHLGVGGIPEGTYVIEYATGSRFSRGCGTFTDEFKAAQMPFTLTLHHVSALRAAARTAMPRILLGPSADGDPNKQPQPVAADRFLADD
jgi:hypothetical protein